MLALSQIIQFTNNSQMLFHRVVIGFRLQSYGKKQHSPNLGGGQIRPKGGQMTFEGERGKHGKFPDEMGVF